MASAVTSQKIGSRMVATAYFHDPDTASAAYLTPDGGTTFHWLDMRDYEAVGISAANSTLTGNGITHLEIWAADDTAATNATVIVASGTLSGTLVENGGFVECTAEQIKEISVSLGFNFRYVTAKITVANSSDECSVAIVRALARRPALNLTPATM
jgi:hypothetical protein